MPIQTSYVVKVILRAGQHEIVSPRFASKDEALAAVSEIKKAQENRIPVPLDWLAVHGDDVLVANLEEKHSGSTSFA